MPTQVAVVYVPAGPFDETYAYAAIAYCRSRGYFPAAVVHGDWRTVEMMLTEHLAQTVIVARSQHSAANAPTSGENPEPSTDLAAVVDLNKQRAEADTRRISYSHNDSGDRYNGRHRGIRVVKAAAEVGMTTGRVRRIIAGEEPAPPAIDPGTVEAVRSITMQMEALGYLPRLW